MGIIKFNNVPSTTPGLEVETFPNYVAPEKEYQVTHVPGRNGDLVVDTKTYKNVPRSYKVSMAVEPPAVSVSGSTASFEATAERALAECKTVISSDVGKVGTTIINSATDPVEDNEPYNFRAVPNGVGDRENDTLIGGTVAWNQLAQFTQAQIPSNNNGITYAYTDGTSVKCNGTATADETRSGWFGLAESNGFKNNVGHKVIIGTAKVSGTVSGDVYFGWGTTPNKIGTSIISTVPSGTQRRFYYKIPNGTTCTDYIFTINCIDLTQMFGSTIADYIYGLETATAGAGVTWFRNLFPKDYYTYNAGELISVKTEAHKTTGKNLFDINVLTATGITISGNSATGSATNFFVAFQNGVNINIPKTSILTLSVSGYTDANQSTSGGGIRFKIKYTDNTESALTFLNADTSELRRSITTESGKTISYIYIDYGSNGNNIWHLSNIQLEIGSTATAYEPYEEHIYPLNPALELRGIPKLNSSNKLYYDGDIYSSDGSVIRKYGIVDLGSVNWAMPANGLFRTSTSNVPNIKIQYLPNWLCDIYEVKSATDYSGWHNRNMAIGFLSSYSDIICVNLAYTDATTFKTAMSGVYLIYELATPVIESTTGLIDNVSIASFDDGADNESVNSLVVDITAIESGSGEKSPENPYIIGGFDNGIITRCGKNLYNKATITRGKYITNTGAQHSTATGSYSDYIPIKKNTPYYFSHISGLGSFYSVAVYDENKTFIETVNIQGSYDSSGTITFTRGAYIRVNVNMACVDTCQIEFGTSATDYIPFVASNTYTFAFGQTVYGGYFDNKGNLVVTHRLIEFDYTSAWAFENSSAGKNFYVACDVDIKPSQTNENMICNVSLVNNVATVKKDHCIISAGRNFNFTWGDTLNLESANDFKTYLQTNNIVIKAIAELTNPITLAITSQDIPTLLGENNIFSNTGNIKSLSYPKQVCSFEPAQEVDDHGTEEYIDNREVAIPVGHESKYFTAGKIYNFSWLDEAGLIKEGELNADTGVLTITNGYKVIDIGDLSWSYNTSLVAFNVQITDIKTVSSGTIGNMSCSIYTVSPAISLASDAANKPDMTIFQQKDNTSVFIKNLSFTDAATFKSAMHGVKLLYELADPVRTIQLTPVQVESLIGHNILISESGNISVTPRTYSTYIEKMNAISDWLHSASGYARLEDTYEPDYYRKAYYDEQTDMENIFNEAGQATLNFICKPQRYLKSGEEPITISSGGLIQNRTRYEAYPILKVTTNNTQGSVAIGNHSITIKAGAGTDPITIDCELQDAWSGTSNKNSYIVLTDGEFPVIDPGTQTVTFNGGIQSVEVIPRWWTV